MRGSLSNSLSFDQVSEASRPGNSLISSGSKGICLYVATLEIALCTELEHQSPSFTGFSKPVNIEI